VKIDAYPDRQDLNLELARRARKAGCRISLGTDSHGASQLRFMEPGLASALMAGIRPVGSRKNRYRAQHQQHRAQDPHRSE
jgi:histidinol phosphatase-like PHP family hydrolase